MALTPQVVEDWIKENVCADKDKSTSKKDIWSSFHAGLPFISIEERANFFSLFGFAIKKFATEWQVPSFPPHLPSRWMLYQLNYDATEWQFPSFLIHPPTWWMLYQLNYEGTKWQAPWSPPHLPPWLMLSQLNYEATEWQVTSSLTHLPPWSIL